MNFCGTINAWYIVQRNNCIERERVRVYCARANGWYRLVVEFIKGDVVSTFAFSVQFHQPVIVTNCAAYTKVGGYLSLCLLL